MSHAMLHDDRPPVPVTPEEAARHRIRLEAEVAAYESQHPEDPWDSEFYDRYPPDSDVPF